MSKLVAAVFLALLCAVAEGKAVPAAVDNQSVVDTGATDDAQLLGATTAESPPLPLQATTPVVPEDGENEQEGDGYDTPEEKETGTGVQDEADATVDESVYFGYGRPKPAPLSIGGYSPASGGSKGDCAMQCQWEDYEPVCNANGRRVAQSPCEARCMGLFANQYRSSWCGVPKQRGRGSWWGRKLKAFA